MSFGSQTVTFVTITGTGVYDELGVESTTKSGVPVPGCRHRPLRVEEKPEWLTDISTRVWKTTAPPAAAAVAAQSTGVLQVDGVDYHIIGAPEVFENFEGPFKVTILSKIQGG